MDGQGREFIWKTPYKPPHAATSKDPPQRPPPERHSPAATQSPRSWSVPAVPPQGEFTFSFPVKSYLPPASRPTFWPSLNRLLPLTPNMSDPATVSEAEKEKMIASLRNHSVNTLAELRRIERVFATMGTSDVTGPMTTAWQYYVNSHMLLTELRSLTRNYPFSSECLDEAKRRVLIDPDSNRSWNFCWLVLTKVHSDNLIPYYAHHQAGLPAMWGNQLPSPEGVQALAAAFVGEWNYAIAQMLRNWEAPPVGREN